MSDSAPVLLTMRSSSTGTPGSGDTSLPVATRMFFALSVVEPPPLSATSTELGPEILPQPWTYSTLFFLNRPSMPLVSPVTTSPFCFCIAPQSNETPVKLTP